MKKGLKAETSITIKATVARVWEGLTKPELIKKYFFGTDASTDWKKGSPIFFRGVWEGKPYEDKGVITDVAPEKFVSYTYWSAFSGTPDLPENYANVRYELSPVAEGVKVTITQDGLDSEERRDHSISNWNMILENLRKLLEQEKL